jgi:cytochrome P450 family 142 subfamily A polypeptide 1
MTAQQLENLGTWSSPDVQRCPYQFLTRLQTEAPVYKDPVTGYYMVTRYKDIMEAANNPTVFSNRAPIAVNKASPAADEMKRRFAERGFPELFILSFDDPPTHEHHRALVNKVFSPSYIKSIEPYLTDLSNELIDKFVEKGEIDLHKEFCVKLPMSVIADQLGVAREDFEDFKIWSEAWNARHDPAISTEMELHYTDLIIDMQNYLHVRAKHYLEHPAENLLSRLVHAEVDGRRLEMNEVICIAQLLLVAGNETTTTALSSALYLMLRDPAIKQRLLGDRTLIPKFIEESLRNQAPVPHLWRITTEDTTLGGTDIPKGSIVNLFWMAGNYDHEQWDDPEAVDMDRKGMRNHLSFGIGIHHCVGNQLARGEMRIGIGLILDRLKDIRLSSKHPEPRYAAHFQVHCLEDLHVEFTPGKRLAA